MPSKSANVKNEKQYEKLKEKGMSKSPAAHIANSPGASSRGGKKSGSGSSPKQGGTAAQKKKAGTKGGARRPCARSKPRVQACRGSRLIFWLYPVGMAGLLAAKSTPKPNARPPRRPGFPRPRPAPSS